jgi:hypothetical protein
MGGGAMPVFHQVHAGFYNSNRARPKHILVRVARFASIVLWVSLALWFGGMIFLFVAVQTLFRSFPRGSSAVALEAAPALFRMFETYQLFLAGVALLAAFAWCFATRSRWVMAIFLLLALAATGAAVSPTLITSKMEQLRAVGQSGSPEFRRLHGWSMQIYLAQAGALLVSVAMLPAAPTARRTAPEAAPA